MRGHFKKAVLVTGSNFICWRKDYRIWFVFLIEGFLVCRYLSGITRYGLETNTTCTPFLLAVLFTDGTIANGLLKVLIYFGLIVLLCNAPFRDQRIHYLVIRSGKKAWWLGECLYILGASLVYILFLALISMLAVAPVITWKPFWGSAMNRILREGSEVMNEYLNHLLVPSEIIHTIYPFAAQWMTALIGWLSFSALGFLIFLVNELTGTFMLGSLAAAFFVLLDPIVRWLAFARSRYWWYYASPVSWSSIEHWDMLGVNRPLNGMAVVFCNAALLILLALATRIVSGRKEVDSMTMI